MAKNISKKSTFGNRGVFDGIERHANTHTHTDTPTDVSTDVSTPTTPPQAAPERKTRRVQLLMKESTVKALDKYAKKNYTSRNDIIQSLVEEFLAKNGV